MPVVNSKVYCAITGISFRYTSYIVGDKDKCILPSLYSHSVTSLSNKLKQCLSDRVYTIETLEYCRLLLAYALWEVNIDNFKLGRIQYSNIDEDDIRYELSLAVMLYNNLPKDRFKVTTLDKQPWQQISNILKGYGTVPKLNDVRDYTTWLSLTYDDVLADLLVEVESMLKKDLNGSLGMLDRIDLTGKLNILPMSYLEDVLETEKPTLNRNRLKACIKLINNFQENNASVMDLT